MTLAGIWGMISHHIHDQTLDNARDGVSDLYRNAARPLWDQIGEVYQPIKTQTQSTLQ